VLMCIIRLVLLIECFDVANLLIARAAARQKNRGTAGGGRVAQTTARATVAGEPRAFDCRQFPDGPIIQNASAGYCLPAANWAVRRRRSHDLPGVILPRLLERRPQGPIPG
jgi:hypothetical protein